jgi:hypothetical protein
MGCGDEPIFFLILAGLSVGQVTTKKILRREQAHKLRTVQRVLRCTCSTYEACSISRDTETICNQVSRHFPSSSTTTVQQARLAQSVARETLNLKVVGSSPTSGLSFLLVPMSVVDVVVVVVVVGTVNAMI